MRGRQSGYTCRASTTSVPVDCRGIGPATGDEEGVLWGDALMQKGAIPVDALTPVRFCQD
jgi:hypothetical protein